MLLRCERLTVPAVALAIAAFFGAPAPSPAALPVTAQGQPLPSLAPMLDKVTPAVVNISTRGETMVRDSPLLTDPFFRFFFDIPSEPRRREFQSQGSGVVVDARRGYILTNHHVIEDAVEVDARRGYILTNHHVIEDAVEVVVTLKDGRRLNAKYVGTDPDTDLAVIQISAEGLTALPMTDSDAVRVGDFVVAIGNPFGLGQTVTSGIVSALGRDLGIGRYENFIQTDASINVGNSGGALVNLRGELVGINTAIIAPSGGNVGIGFAIPSNVARRILNQLVTFGEVHRGMLGVHTQDLTRDLAKEFGVAEGQGALVVKVLENSPAAAAGLRVGDLIVAIDDRPIHNSADVGNVLGLLDVGESVRVDIIRDGHKRSLRTTLVDRREAELDARTLNRRLSGALLTNIEPGTSLYGRVEGVLVAEVERASPAWHMGLRAGDVVVGANRSPVRNLRELRETVNRSSGRLSLTVQRGDATVFILVR